MVGPSDVPVLPPGLRRILVIEGGAIDPGRNAGDRATVDLMEALVSMGGSVRFLPLGVKGRGDAIELAALDRGGIRTYAADEDELASILAREPVDVVIASRPGPAAVAMGALRSHPPVVRIFWGHDIHSRRLASQRVVRGDGDGLAARVTALTERAAWEFYALAGGYRLASLGLQRAWSTVRACFPAPSVRPWVFTAFTGLTALTTSGA